jgi:hypothetical protein
MSVFGPNQVEELIVLNSTNVADSVVKSYGTTVPVDTEGEKFRFFQDEGDNLTSQFSDVIDPSKVNKVILKEYSPEVQKEVTVSTFTDSTIVANATYILEVRILEDGGSLSSENFAIVSGYYQTGESDTAQTVAEALVASINANLARRGGSELTVTAVAAGADYSITIEGQAQSVVQGKIVGRPIRFEVNSKIFNTADPISKNVNNLTVETTTKGFSGTGTGKYAVNLEWFTKGYKYPHYRQTGYPADFTERIPFFTSADKTYNVVHVKAYSDRQSPTVEKQQKVFTILIERTDLASNADTNSFLAQLRTAVGTSAVPDDLAVA